MSITKQDTLSNTQRQDWKEQTQIPQEKSWRGEGERTMHFEFHLHSSAILLHNKLEIHLEISAVGKSLLQVYLLSSEQLSQGLHNLQKIQPKTAR